MKKLAAHIVILTPGFPKDTEDSLCVPPVQSLLLNLKKSNPEIRVSVIALQYPYKEQYYNWNGIDVYACGGNNKKLLGKLITWRKALKEFQKIHQKQPVNLVHSLWLNECAVVGQRISSRYSIPHVNTLMGQDATIDNKYLKLLAKKQLHAVFVSENQQKIYWEHNTAKLSQYSLIPWGYDHSEIPHQKQERTIDVLGVGSLTKLKNYSLFIDVIAELVKDFPQLNAKILGEGEERLSLEQKIKEAGLERNIQLLGLVSRKEVLANMQKSKILLHTSNYESFGFVFVEALASGTYVVSKPIGFAQSINEWRLAQTKQEMIARVKTLLSDELTHESVYLSPVEETVQQYVELYRGLINEG